MHTKRRLCSLCVFFFNYVITTVPFIDDSKAQVVIRSFPFIINLPIKAVQANGKVKLMVKALGREILKHSDAASSFETDEKSDLLSLLREFIKIYRTFPA
jgi:hypothetical protein